MRVTVHGCDCHWHELSRWHRTVEYNSRGGPARPAQCASGLVLALVGNINCSCLEFARPPYNDSETQITFVHSVPRTARQRPYPKLQNPPEALLNRLTPRPNRNNAASVSFPFVYRLPVAGWYKQEQGSNDATELAKKHP